MKILIADAFPPSHVEKLKAAGHECRVDAALDEATLPDAIGSHEVVIVRSTRVTAAAIDNGDALKLIIRAGAGTNTIDKAHAAQKNVRVCNVPGANSIAVAELAMGLILAIDRRLADNVADLKKQVWNKKTYSRARGLYGQTLGILGIGAIGIALAKRARAFGLNLLTLAKPGRGEQTQQRMRELGFNEVQSLDELLPQCDIVSLHMPVADETRGMVDAAFLAQMREGAILINTSRGELIDEAALLDAMQSKGIRAGLDVYQNEPAAGDKQFVSALAQHPNVCGTHHIGASTEQAQIAVADGVLRVIESFAAGDLLFCVNA